MTDLNKDALEFFKKQGKRGGNTTKQKYGKEHFSNAGKVGMAKRWAKHKKKKKE